MSFGRIFCVILFGFCLRTHSSGLPGQLLWRVDDARLGFNGSAIGPDGRLHLSAARVDAAPLAPRGVLLTLLPDGSEQCRAEFEFPPMEDSVVCTANRVWVLDENGIVWVFDRENPCQSSGSFSGIASAPAIDPQGNLYLLRRSDGSPVYPTSLPPEAQIPRWSDESGDLTGALVSIPQPVISGQVVAFSVRRVKVFDLNGAGLWVSPSEDDTPGYIVPTQNGGYIRGQPLLQAFNAGGNPIWSRPEIPATAGPVIAENGQFILGTSAGDLLALDEHGAVTWSTNLGVGLRRMPVCASDGTLVVATEDGHVVARREDGSAFWSFAMEGVVSAALNLDGDGNVLAATGNGEVVLIRGSAPAASSLWPMSGHDRGRLGYTPLSLPTPGVPEGVTINSPSTNGILTLSWDRVDGARGYEVWRGTNSEVSLAEPVATNLLSVTTYSDDSAPGHVMNYFRVRAFNEQGPGPFAAPVSGIQTQRLWTVPLPGFAQLPVVLSDGRIAVAYVDGVVTLHPDGSESWRRTFSGSLVGTKPSAGPDGRLYIGIHNTGGNTNRIACLDANGDVVWSVNLPDGPLGSLALGRSNAVYALTSSGRGQPRLVAIREGGTVAWTVVPGIESPRIYDHPTVLEGDVVLFPNRAVLQAYLPNGDPAWNVATMSPSWAPVVAFDGSHAIATSSQGGFYLLGANGTRVWTNTVQSAPTQSEPVVDRHGHIHSITDSGFLRSFDRDGTLVREPVRVTPSVGQTPALSADGRLWFHNGRRLQTVSTETYEIKVVAEMSAGLAGFPVLSTEGRLYSIDGRGRLNAFPAAPLDIEAPWPMYRGGPGGEARGRDAAPREPLLVSAGITNGLLGLRLVSSSTNTFKLQISTDLKTWNPIDPSVVVSNAPLEVQLPVDVSERTRFYRALLSPPENPAP